LQLEEKKKQLWKAEILVNTTEWGGHGGGSVVKGDEWSTR